MARLLVILLIALPAIHGFEATYEAFNNHYGVGNVKQSEDPLKKSPGMTRKLASLKPIKDSFNRLQQKINSRAPSDSLKKAMKMLDTKIGNLTVGDGIDKIQQVATSIEKNWDGLTGGNGLDIAKSVVDVVGSIGSLVPPPAGTVVSAFTGLISFFMGLFGQSQKSMGEIIKEVIQKEIRDQYYNEMRDKIEGAINHLDNLQVFLNNYVGETLNDQNFNFMTSQFQTTSNLELRGQLGSLIARTASTKKYDQAGNVVDMVDGYVVIASMLEVVMHTMKSILEDNPNTALSAKAIGDTIINMRKQCQGQLQLMRTPQYAQGITIASYVPEQHPSVEKYMDLVGVNYADFNLAGCWRMTARRWNTHIWVQKDMTIWGYDDVKRGNTVRFEKSGPNTWSWSVDGDNGRRGNVVANIKRKDQAEFKVSPNKEKWRIYKFTDGGYMLLNEKVPTLPIWMQMRQSIVRAGSGYDDVDPQEWRWDLNTKNC